MTTSAVRRRALQPKLAARLVMVLSIAIMPLGLISVYQTHRVLKERQSLSETALLERTQQAVSDARELIQSAMSTAETLAYAVSVLPPAERTCDALMVRIVRETENFAFAGFHEADRGFACDSQVNQPDGALRVPPSLPQDDPETPQVIMQPLEFLGGVATLSVTAPVIVDGQYRGAVWIAVPVSALSTALSASSEDVDLVLFQRNGELIAPDDFGDNRRSVLPEGRQLADLAAQGRVSFRGRNRDGDARDFAMSPIVEGRVFALGSWEPQHRGIALPAYEEAVALYFPLAMWAIAIGVAYVGVHRLVIRHVRRLRRWMRQYSAGQTDIGEARLDNAPEELEVVADAFRAMTARMSEQDRRREDDLREKTVLLREVHHRVKNNLQLISSILNMQIRNTEIAESKRILRQVQDRVLALSAIHRYLYLSRKLSLVRADELLKEIIQHLVTLGSLDETSHRIQLATELDPVEITPDQSVPLSLLATEAAMNAVKYCGIDGDEQPWINIALKQREDGDLVLSMVNSLARNLSETDLDDRPDGTGLGSRLIQSFVMQLNGTLDVQALPKRYELHVVFPLEEPRKSGLNDID